MSEKDKFNNPFVVDIAAQIWCTPECKDIEMDHRLAYAFARVLDNWIDTSTHFSRGMLYYRDLLDECGNILGNEAFVTDDGSLSDTVLRAKIPELVGKLKAAVDKQCWKDESVNL